MSRRHVRPILAACFAAMAAVCIAASPGPDAARTTGVLERFVARAPDPSDPAAPTGPIAIMIDRWSTDAESETLREILIQRGPEALLPALHKVWRPTGVVLIPGIQAAGARALTPRVRNLLYARAIETPNGRQVIVAADQDLAFGEPTRTWPTGEAFTLLDIRFGPDGTGVGKLASPDKVVYNEATKIIELENYAAHPTRLTEVRSEKPGSAGPH